MSRCVGKFLANTLIPFQRLHSLAFRFRTFAYAKDQASSLLNGLLRNYPTPYYHELFGLNPLFRQELPVYY